MPITNLYRDEILPLGTVPSRLRGPHTLLSPGEGGRRPGHQRDKAVHQFEKVEMYKFVEPENSDAELESLVADAEEVCEQLGIPIGCSQLCTGDLGFASVKSYDVEMWAPGSGEWLEVSSCSNCTDFQARRASIRYRLSRRHGRSWCIP